MDSSYALGAGVVATLLKLKAHERNALLKAFDELASTPYDKGDYTEQWRDRPVQVKRFDRWNVVYWHDPWAKEVRIVRLEVVRS